MNNTDPFTLTVDLGIALARHAAGGCKKPKLSMRLERPVTLGQLLQMLGIPAEYVSFITINGEKRDLDALVGPGDAVILFPYIAGG